MFFRSFLSPLHKVCRHPTALLSSYLFLVLLTRARVRMRIRLETMCEPQALNGDRPPLAIPTPIRPKDLREVLARHDDENSVPIYSGFNMVSNSVDEPEPAVGNGLVRPNSEGHNSGAKGSEHQIMRKRSQSMSTPLRRYSTVASQAPASRIFSDYGTVESPVPFQRSHSFYSQLHVSRQTMVNSASDGFTRLESLHEMRPHRLIGNSHSMKNWPELLKSDGELATMKKPLREYYEQQNEIINRYIDIDRLLDSGISLSMLRGYSDDLSAISISEMHHHAGNQRHGIPGDVDFESSPLMGSVRQEKSSTVMFAILVNFFINFLLLLGKTVVALLTNSLSIIASLVDSALDFLSTFIIWVSTRLVEKKDHETKFLYPVGRSRLEPIGVLVFSVIIVISFLKVADEALTTLIAGSDGSPVVSIGLPSMIIMIFTVVVKVFCWIWCRSINSSAVQALAQDAMTDIIFNIFSMLFPVIGSKTQTWWLDPLGALLLSLYIVWSWGATALEHIGNLTGSVASPEERQMVLYMCMRFADCIEHITALNAYHTGDRIIVEVDVILSQDLTLKDCHDIGESLQYAIETLPFVERAFVHLDYRTGNYAGHLE